jgi:steroid delta-isomerase-like uncharacterized protein
MTSEENKARLLRYIDEVWNQGNMEAIDDFLSPEFIQHVPGVSPGRVGVKQFFTMLHSAFSDIRNAVEDVIAEGDRVVWRSTVRGTHTGAFRGIPATNRPIEISSTAILRIADGKFVEHWGQQDNLGLLQQLGVVPAPEHT